MLALACSGLPSTLAATDAVAVPKVALLGVAVAEKLNTGANHALNAAMVGESELSES